VIAIDKNMISEVKALIASIFPPFCTRKRTKAASVVQWRDIDKFS